jgi:hypothetical protein
MVAPLVAKGVEVAVDFALGKAWDRWKAFTESNTQAMIEADAAERLKWRVERDHLLQRRLVELETVVGANAAQLQTVTLAVDTLLSDRQFFRLERNYEFEAVREVTDGRSRMLAFAAAWSVDPDLTVAQLARVERAIREIDPADVEVLKLLGRAQLSPPAPPRDS